MSLNRVPLFNPNGSDSAQNQQLVNGNATGIANLNESRYGWANNLYNSMRNNFWIPEIVSMTPDKTTIKYLTTEEYSAHLDSLGFLIALDSFAQANLPNVMHFISAPNVRLCIGEQTSQEGMHTQAYQYIAENTLPKADRDKIYTRWKTNPMLLDRINFLSEMGEGFLENKTEENFLKVCIANFCLEGIFFYQGFNFYDQLASRKMLISTQKEISYIRRDEITHVTLFKNILLELRRWFTFDVDEMMIYVLRLAVGQEMKWGKTIYQNILGINDQTIEDYCYYIGQERADQLNLPQIFPKRENPYKHLVALQSTDGKGKKENFFETTVTSYDRSESLGGFDDF